MSNKHNQDPCETCNSDNSYYCTHHCHAREQKMVQEIAHRLQVIKIKRRGHTTKRTRGKSKFKPRRS